MRLIAKIKHIFKLRYINMVRFEILPFQNYTLIPAFFPVFITLLKRFDWKLYWKVSNYSHHGALNISNRLAVRSCHNLFGLETRKKSEGDIPGE